MVWTQEDRDQFGEYDNWWMVQFVDWSATALLIQCQVDPYIFPLPKNWTMT